MPTFHLINEKRNKLYWHIIITADTSRKILLQLHLESMSHNENLYLEKKKKSQTLL